MPAHFEKPMPKDTAALRRASFGVLAEMVINAFISLLERASHFRAIQVEAITSMLKKTTNTRWLILSQKQLEEMAESAPDKVCLIEQLIKHHGIAHDENHSFILCGERRNGTPFIQLMDDSLDIQFKHAMDEAIAKTYHQCGSEEKALIRNRIIYTVYPELITFIQDYVTREVERDNDRHHTITPFDDLEPAESENLILLLQEARVEAECRELSALQLLLEGRLEKLMPDNPRLAAFNLLSEYKKKQARRHIIKQMWWENYYNT